MQDKIEILPYQSEDLPNEVNYSTYDLPLGEALPAEESYMLTAKEKSKLIVLIGPSGSGKTSLLTALYQLFQNGSIDKYHFAGSNTLLAFEQRAYLTRLQSKRTVPDTPKTRRGVSDLLHLRIWDSNTGKITNLLISDFSGEDFSSVIANTVYAHSDFDILKGAGHLSFILDGDLITQKQKRQSTLKDAVELFRTIIDSGLLGPDVNISVIMSKYDIIEQKYISDSSLKDFEGYLKEQFDALAVPINKKIVYLYVTVMGDNNVNVDSIQTLKRAFINYMSETDQIKVKKSSTNISLSSQVNLFAERY